jgi:competence ComEA-like helix-hairpin-helix protein
MNQHANPMAPARPERLRRTRLAWAAAVLALALGGAPAFGAETSAPKGVVNVNTATAPELARLPGIGEAKARAILQAREQRGGFESVEDLLEVKGIGSSALERIRPFVVLEGKSTLVE